MTTKNGQLQAKSFDIPDETIPVGSVARVEVVHLGDITANRVTFRPDFHWTEHVKPMVGTDLCELERIGYVVSGRAAIRMVDGTEREVAAGDAFHMPPGHDIWVIGDEPYIAVDFSLTDQAATPLR